MACLWYSCVVRVCKKEEGKGMSMSEYGLVHINEKEKSHMHTEPATKKQQITKRVYVCVAV